MRHPKNDWALFCVLFCLPSSVFSPCLHVLLSLAARKSTTNRTGIRLFLFGYFTCEWMLNNIPRPGRVSLWLTWRKCVHKHLVYTNTRVCIEHCSMSVVIAPPPLLPPQHNQHESKMLQHFRYLIFVYRLNTHVQILILFSQTCNTDWCWVYFLPDDNENSNDTVTHFQVIFIDFIAFVLH